MTGEPMKTGLMAPEEVEFFGHVRGLAGELFAREVAAAAALVGVSAGVVAAMGMLSVLVEVLDRSTPNTPDRDLVISRRMHGVVDVALANFAARSKPEGRADA